MKIARALLIALAAVTLTFAQSTTAVQSSGPEIIVDRAASDIFPESWLTAKISAKAEPLDKEEQPRGRQIVEKALAKCPAAVLGANLKKNPCGGSARIQRRPDRRDQFTERRLCRQQGEVFVCADREKLSRGVLEHPAAELSQPSRSGCLAENQPA